MNPGAEVSITVPILQIGNWCLVTHQSETTIECQSLGFNLALIPTPWSSCYREMTPRFSPEAVCGGSASGSGRGSAPGSFTAPLCHTTHQRGWGWERWVWERGVTGIWRQTHHRVPWALQEIRLLDSQTAPHLLMIQWVYCMSVCLLVYWWGERCQRGGEAGDFLSPSKKGYLSLKTEGEQLNAMHNISCQLLEIIFF